MKNQEITTIYVNPVPRMSAQGRHRQVYNVTNASGEAIPSTVMGKNKEFGVPTEYSFRLSTSNNKLITGLDKLIDNPFKDLEPTSIVAEYGLSQEWLHHLDNIVKQPQIKLQTKFEIIDNVGYNFYTNDVTHTMFSPNWKNNLGKESNFLEKFKLILYDHANAFSDDTPRGRLAIQLLKNHPKVAKSKNEINSSVHDWYISLEHEAQMEKQKKRDIIENAIGKWSFGLKSNSTPYVIYQLATLLTNHDGNPIVKGKMNDSSVKENISDYLHDTGTYQMENIDKFNKFYDMLQSKEGRERFYIMYLVGQAINTGVITVRDGFYIWHKMTEPNMQKHTSYDALVSSLQREYVNYDPTDKTVRNWYKDLYEELVGKAVWIE